MGDEPHANNDGGMTMATPRQVRAEMKRRGFPHTINKDGGSWYVWGPYTEFCEATALMTWTFDGKPAEFWVDIIADIINEGKTKHDQFMQRAGESPAFEAWVCENFAPAK